MNILNNKSRRKISLFLICLFIACTTWVVFQLNKKYQFKIPAKIFVDQIQIDFIGSTNFNILVEGSGWQLLFHQLSKANLEFHLSPADLTSNEFIQLSIYKEKFNQSLKNFSILDFYPEKILIKNTKEYFKKVPIKPMLALYFKENYQTFAPITCSPDSVTLYGEQELLNTISEWKTLFKIVNNIHQSMNLVLQVDTLWQNKIIVAEKNVLVKLTVDKCTEASLQVAVRVKSKQKISSIKLIPNSVEITCLVPLSKYEQLIPDLFDVSIDIDQERSNPKVKLNSSPDYVRNIKIRPNRVNYYYTK